MGDGKNVMNLVKYQRRNGEKINKNNIKYTLQAYIS